MSFASLHKFNELTTIKKYYKFTNIVIYDQYHVINQKILNKDKLQT